MFLLFLDLVCPRGAAVSANSELHVAKYEMESCYSIKVQQQGTKQEKYTDLSICVFFSLSFFNAKHFSLDFYATQSFL